MKEETQGLFNQLAGLRNLKANIIAQGQNKSIASDYYYNVTVEEKHRTYVFGFRGEPYYTEHKELRFNSALYNGDLNDSIGKIRNLNAQIRSDICHFAKVSTF